MDRACARGGRGRTPGEGHCVSRRPGGARPLRQALPGVRRAGAAHRLRRERNELLRALSDRRQDPCRPRTLAAAQEELAALAGRTGIKGVRPLFGVHMNRRSLLALLSLTAFLPAFPQQKKPPPNRPVTFTW